jgi:hypothetical protein
MNISIFGYPRSGSTMFYNMLRAAVSGHNFTDRERSAVFALYEEPWPLITKFPSDCFYWREILEIDNDARFIAMIRDPRSVICSRHKTTGKAYKVSWDHTIFGKPRRSPLRRIKYQMSTPGRYRSHWGLIEWDNAIEDAPTSMTVRYEDLVSNPDSFGLKLTMDLGLEIRAPLSDFHLSDIPEKLRHQMNGVRPVEMGRINSWQDHPKRVKQQFTECPELHDLVIKHGYEKDTAWLKNV